MDRKLTVARGYDRVAEGYLRWRQSLDRERDLDYVDRLTERLAPGARVLDLGCGAGKPVGAYLSERFDIVGVDISRGQLELARKLVPRATLLLADMCAPPFAPASFEAIAALYSVIHVPREEHATVLREASALLRLGGRALLVLGAEAWEGSSANWLGLGAEMFWSHYGPESYLPMVERAGLSVLVSEIVPEDGGAHLFVLAERPA